VAGGAPAHDAVVGLFIREDEGNRPSATRMVQQQCAATAPSTSDLIRPLSPPHLLQRPVSTFVRLVRIEGIGDYGVRHEAVAVLEPYQIEQALGPRPGPSPGLPDQLGEFVMVGTVYGNRDR
jgi:hypothetical protein